MKGILILFLAAPLVVVAVTKSVASQPQGQNPSRIVGDWKLITVSDRTGRDIRFNQPNEGTYLTSRGDRTPIKNVKFEQGYVYFEVPALRLYFKMQFVNGDRLEGTMAQPSENQVGKPQPVRMIRK